MHKAPAYVFAAVVVLHVLAVLRPRLVKRDDGLRRIAWGANRAA